MKEFRLLSHRRGYFLDIIAHVFGNDNVIDSVKSRKALVNALDTLPGRGVLVLLLTIRFDLTLEQTAKIMGITRERVQQIQAKSLRLLRHPSRSKLIKDFIVSEPETS